MSDQTATHVARNTLVMLAQQFATGLSSLLLMMFLPRYLGPEDFGRLSLALSITSMFGAFVGFGGFQQVAKMVSRSHDTAPVTMMNAIGFRLVFSVISIIAMVVFSYTVRYPNSTKILLFICGAGLIWQGVYTVLYGCFQGFEMLHYTSIGAVVERLFVSIVCIAALLLGASSIVIAMIFTISTLLNVLVLVKYSRRIIRYIPAIDWKASFVQVREAVPYFLFTLFGIIYYRIDTVMLSLMTSERVVGWYSASYKLFDYLNLLPIVFTISVFPVLSRLWQQEREGHSRVIQKSLQFIGLAAIPTTIAIYVFAEHIIQFLYGLGGYSQSIIVLKYLSLGLPFLFIDMILGTTLLASDRQRPLSVISFCASPTNIILNYFLIPYWQGISGNGGTGAAIATVITEACVMFAALSIMPKGVFDGFNISVWLKMAAAGLIMFAAGLGLEHLGVPWIVGLGVSVAAFLGFCFSVKTFDSYEIQFAKSFLSIDGMKKTFLSGNRAPKMSENEGI